jgi:hypothetical protein
MPLSTIFFDFVTDMFEQDILEAADKENIEFNI